MAPSPPPPPLTPASPSAAGPPPPLVPRTREGMAGRQRSNSTSMLASSRTHVSAPWMFLPLSKRQNESSSAILIMRSHSLEDSTLCIMKASGMPGTSSLTASPRSAAATAPLSKAKAPVDTAQSGIAPSLRPSHVTGQKRAPDDWPSAESSSSHAMSEAGDMTAAAVDVVADAGAPPAPAMPLVGPTGLVPPEPDATTVRRRNDDGAWLRRPSWYPAIGSVVVWCENEPCIGGGGGWIVVRGGYLSREDPPAPAPAPARAWRAS
mmetsp:Transcript_80341/g.228778  ORF Transcript_80341/g.228778 Transcript_80341/m.228778 type:complete len:264 (+) Transcript_80341:666-1457(+)